MTHNANALNAFVEHFAYPVAVYKETGDDISEHCTKQRLKSYIRAGLVTGHGPAHRIKKIRFVAGTREIMKRLRIAQPDHAKHIPLAGDVVKAYMDQRRKYRRSGLPRRFGPVVTVLSGGRTCEEVVTEVV